MKIDVSPRGTVALLSIVMFVGLLGVFYVQADGDEIQACVKNSGMIYIIGEGFKQTECSNNDQLLSWNQQGPKGDKGDQGNPGTNASALHLYDVNGLDLGILISVGDVSDFRRLVSYLSDPGVFLDFRQDSATKTVLMNNTKNIYFPFDNCTGNPYSTATENPGATIVNNSGRVFKYTNQPLVQGNDSWSRLGNICENGQGPSQLYAPLVEVPLPFSLPPAWPLSVH